MARLPRVASQRYAIRTCLILAAALAGTAAMRAQQQARSVVGVDLSEKMLARARASTNDAAITYHRLAIEDIDFSAGAFDVVLSSLALHYVERFDLVCRNVHHCLVAGGQLRLLGRTSSLHGAGCARLVLWSAGGAITLAARSVSRGRPAPGQIFGA